MSIDPAIMRSAVGNAAGAMKILANEDRLMLLCSLSQGERCVSDLELLLQIRQPTLSQQLGVLRTEGVVTTRRDGKNIYYAIAKPELLQILKLLYSLYCPQGDR